MCIATKYDFLKVKFRYRECGVCKIGQSIVDIPVIDEPSSVSIIVADPLRIGTKEPSAMSTIFEA